MPTYDYDCDTCGQSFEIFQSITAPPVETCPQCGGNVKRRINGGAGLIFKGSGFYETDYKRSASTNSPDKPSKESSATSATKPAGEKADKTPSQRPAESTPH